MAGGAVEVELADVGSENLGVALFVEFLGDEFLEGAADEGTFRFPEDQALADGFVDVEEAEFTAEAAVVAFLGFFEAVEMLGEGLLVFEGGAVEALELAFRFIAHVEGGRDRHDFDVLALRGVADVWAGAEIDEIAVLEAGDLFSLGDLVDEVELEAGGVPGAFSEAAEASGFRHGFGILAGDRFVFELLVLLGDFLHLLLDFLEIVGGDAVLHFEIVVEAVLNWRAVGELRVGPDAEDGGGHDVRGGVAHALEVGHLVAFV